MWMMPPHLYVNKKSDYDDMNLAMETSYIRSINVKFPNFSQNAANFPNSMGPDPISKKGCVILLQLWQTSL